MWLCPLDNEEEVSSLPLSQFPFLHLVVSVPGSLPRYDLVLPGMVTVLVRNLSIGPGWGGLVYLERR